MMFIDNFSYFTYSYLEIDLQSIHSFLLKEFGDNEKFKIKLNQFQFDLYVDKPIRGGSHFPKAIFYNPKCCKDKTIMVSNYSDGWDTLNNLICNKLNTSYFSFKLSKVGIPDILNSMSYWGSGSYNRIVYSMKDPKWIFYEAGAPLWFEDIENYKQKLIKNKLNRDILISYSVMLGVDVRDSLFGTSDGSSICLENVKW